MSLCDDIKAFAQAENDARLAELLARKAVRRDVERIERDLAGLDDAILAAAAEATDENKVLNAKQLQLDQGVEEAKQTLRRLQDAHYQESAVIRRDLLEVHQRAQEPQRRKVGIEKELVELLEVTNDRGRFLEQVRTVAEQNARAQRETESLESFRRNYGPIADLFGAAIGAVVSGKIDTEIQRLESELAQCRDPRREWRLTCALLAWKSAQARARAGEPGDTDIGELVGMIRAAFPGVRVNRL